MDAIQGELPLLIYAPLVARFALILPCNMPAAVISMVLSNFRAALITALVRPRDCPILPKFRQTPASSTLQRCRWPLSPKRLRFGVAYDWNRLVSDPVYNTQMGAAEIGALLKEYRGSYVMAFAGYNAGRGRVAEWVAKHGDPRDPKVDAVDWVERIPFAETRNYVQRVMENLQVYCARFGASTATVEPNLHRAAPVGSRANPVLVEAIP
jgi:hypothetical protein